MRRMVVGGRSEKTDQSSRGIATWLPPIRDLPAPLWLSCVDIQPTSRRRRAAFQTVPEYGELLVTVNFPLCALPALHRQRFPKVPEVMLDLARSTFRSFCSTELRENIRASSVTSTHYVIVALPNWAYPAIQ
ncbi:hypothetical protein DFH09DRAFT_1325516 [Mycena vulgaris]|nr:hypothetical protein DFH09DRAFT_1325516 [Mycena vulgaris]